MITYLRRANGEQRKLILSVGISFLTRVPGAIGLMWFLPLLRFGLGTEDYANLLTAMALGTASGFLFGGFNTIGRRTVGEAYSASDPMAEANAFISLVVANLATFSFPVGIILAYCRMHDNSLALFVVALLPMLSWFLLMFDDVRSAYNEHYITATFLIVLQSIGYAIGFSVSELRHNLILGALVLNAPYLLTSLITGALLLRNRSYLFTGRPVAVWFVIRQGAMLALADGFLMATLSLSVVWLQNSASATTAAWFGTNVRLFQTLLTPVIMLLYPLSAYIRIRWNSKSLAQQRTFTKATYLIGLGYSALVAVTLFVASRLYVDALLHLPAPGGLVRSLPIFLLFGAIIAYRSYSSIAYVVHDKTAQLSSWTTGVIGAAVMVGAAASVSVDPLNAVNIYALTAGLLIFAVLSLNVAQFVRKSRICEKIQDVGIVLTVPEGPKPALHPATIAGSRQAKRVEKSCCDRAGEEFIVPAGDLTPDAD